MLCFCWCSFLEVCFLVYLIEKGLFQISKFILIKQKERRFLHAIGSREMEDGGRNNHVVYRMWDEKERITKDGTRHFSSCHPLSLSTWGQAKELPWLEPEK